MQSDMRCRSRLSECLHRTQYSVAERLRRTSSSQDARIKKYRASSTELYKIGLHSKQITVQIKNFSQNIKNIPQNQPILQILLQFFVAMAKQDLLGAQIRVSDFRTSETFVRGYSGWPVWSLLPDSISFYLDLFKIRVIKSRILRTW